MEVCNLVQLVSYSLGGAQIEHPPKNLLKIASTES
jgi:hypothetical protein